MNWLLQLLPDFLINMAFGGFFVVTVGIIALLFAIMCAAAFFEHRRLGLSVSEEDFASIGFMIVALVLAYKCLT